MVRRLKENIRSVQGGFPIRKVKPVVIADCLKMPPNSRYLDCSTNVAQLGRIARKHYKSGSGSSGTAASSVRLLHAA
jgi:hypothetical protein